MNKDKRRLYTLSTLLCVLLAVVFFIPLENSVAVTAFLMVPFALAVIFLIRKRKSPSINKRQVLLIVSVSGLLRIMIHYLLGLYFGMGTRGKWMSVDVLVKVVIPTVLVIISAEIIRNVLLAQEKKYISAMTYAICFLSDCLILGNAADIDSFSTFMDIAGLAILPAITMNMLCHYLSRNYGVLPGIVLRVMLSVYAVLIPYVPLMSEAIKVFIDLVFPLVLLWFINLLFGRQRTTRKRTKHISHAATAVACILMISMVMIISCQFKYGALVIGSESTTGDLNVGDAAVYERYEDQIIKVGDIIVFRSGNSRVIHRVVKIENVDGNIIYFTKGDANEDIDLGYRTGSDILGIIKFKISYVGYPTIWMQDMFSKTS
ncbi:MAG: signal peptidase I [Clostridia bacterium]|nr:signal peptidase I [Clostridia bacterium]